MTHRQSFALDVAAPSLRPDRDAPWTGAPGANGDAGLATMFWVSFHGLSVFIHTVLITLSVAGPMFLAIVPIPFVAAMCSEVKTVDKPIERVEMAIVELPPPPPPEPPEPPPPPVIEEPVVDTKKAARATKLARNAALKDAMEFGMIGLLSANSENSAQLSAIFSSDVVALEGNVLGSLRGAEIGDSFGAGGLGLVGIGEGGGGRGEGIGLGSIGTIGRGGGVEGGYGVGGLGKRSDRKRVRVALDELAPPQRRRLEVMLTSCSIEETITGTVVVVDDAVTSVTLDPSNACAARMLKQTMFDADGTFALTLSPVAP